MQITIHITEESTQAQLKAAQALINSLLGEDSWPKSSAKAETEDSVDKPAEEPVAAEPPKRKRRTKAEMEEARAAEAVDGSDVDQLEEAAKDEATAEEGKPLDRAIAEATTLVANGKVQVVKAALEDAGVKRVSELQEKDVPAFLEALGV